MSDSDWFANGWDAARYEVVANAGTLNFLSQGKTDDSLNIPEDYYPGAYTVDNESTITVTWANGKTSIGKLADDDLSVHFSGDMKSEWVTGKLTWMRSPASVRVRARARDKAGLPGLKAHIQSQLALIQSSLLREDLDTDALKAAIPILTDLASQLSVGEKDRRAKKLSEILTLHLSSRVNESGKVPPRHIEFMFYILLACGANMDLKPPEMTDGELWELTKKEMRDGGYAKFFDCEEMPLKDALVECVIKSDFGVKVTDDALDTLAADYQSLSDVLFSRYA